MKLKARSTRPPIEGAVRCYRLAPTGTDAFAWVAERLADKGWTVLEEDHYHAAQANGYVNVTVWAIPPRRGGR